MKNSFTPSVPAVVQRDSQNAGKEQPVAPSERTLAYLRLFARNYQVEEKMPEGLGGIILSWKASGPFPAENITVIFNGNFC